MFFPPLRHGSFCLFLLQPSVTGECETSYWVRPDITHDGQPLMNIMKVRNFDRCMDRVFFIRDMFNSRHCDYCEPNMVRFFFFYFC